MNAILARWGLITNWASRNGGLVLLGLSLLILSAHQGTGIPSAFFALTALVVSGFRLPLDTRLSTPVVGITGLILTSLLLAAVVHPTPGVLPIMVIPFLVLCMSLTLGYRLEEGQRNKAAFLIVGVAALCALWGLPDRWAHRGPYESWFKDYNSAATLFNLGILAALSLAFSLNGRRRAVCFAFASCLLLAVVYSASRGGLLTLAAGLALVALRERSTLWVRISAHGRLFAGVGVTGLIGLGYVARATGMAERMSQLGSDESASGRLAMWKAGWHMLQDGHWMTGYGPGMWMHLYPAYRLPADYESAGFMAHNDYVQSLVEGGPLLCAALVTFALLACWLTVSAKSTRRGSLLAAGAAVASLHAAFNFPFYNAQLTLAMGLMLGLALAENKGVQVLTGAIAKRLTRLQLGVLIGLLPLVFWIALEAITGQAAFMNGTWPAKFIPNAGKLEVVTALFGAHAERALTAEPRKTLATHYLGMAVGRTEDSIEVRRDMLNKAIGLYAGAPAPVPGAYTPAQTHLMYRGIEAGLLDKAETVARIKGMLRVQIDRYPHKSDLRLAWADVLMLESGYPAAAAYLDAERKVLTTMDFERRATYWKRSRDPNKSSMSAAEISRGTAQ